jgi:hypothetical protein
MKLSLGDDVRYGDEGKGDSQAEIWAAFEALYGAWADREDLDDELLIDEPLHTQPIKSYVVHLTIQGISRGKPSALIDSEIELGDEELS